MGYRLDATELLGKANDLRLLGIGVEGKPNSPGRSKVRCRFPAVSRAYSFRRRVNKAAWLELKTQPTAWQAQGLLQWRLDAQYADLLAKFTITSPREDLNLVEFFIDKSMTLADVSGPDVTAGICMKLGFRYGCGQPRKETTLMLSGWRSFPAKGGAAAEKGLVVPGIYPLQTQVTAINLEVVPAPRTQLRLKQSLNLRSNAARTFLFAIEKAPYEATFAWTAETKSLEGSILTKVQRIEQGMEIWHGIRLTTDRGKLPSIKLHLKDWLYEPVILNAPGGNRAANGEQGPEASSLDDPVPAGLAERSVHCTAWDHRRGQACEHFLAIRGDRGHRPAPSHGGLERR